MTESHTPWLNVSQLSNTVWRIEEAGLVSEYLIIGDDRALLIDCGFGIGDLSKTVAGLTLLPLTIVNTHGHLDHTMGNYQFGDGIYIHEEDVPELKKSYEPTERGMMLRRFPQETLPPEFREQAWIHARLPRYHSFKGQPSFDLGGRVVDVIETPGHSPGSICLYDRKEQLLFVGDNILADHTLLMLPESLPLTRYLESMEKLAAMADLVDKVFPAHGPAPLEPAVLKQMSEGVHKVLNGELKGTPETSLLGTGLVVGFGSCGIKYDENKLK